MSPSAEQDFLAIAPGDYPSPQVHQLILSIVIPRPIGLISTISREGVPNLAPFSFFQAVAAEPPTLLFCPNRNRWGQPKHSLLNALSTREFVANAVTEEIAERVNYASGEFPDGVSEFEEAELTPLPSQMVKPFRVAESPVQMECRVLEVLELSHKPLGGSVVIGEIVMFHIRREVLDPERLMVSLRHYRPISRLGGITYGLLREFLDMPRPQMTPDGRKVKEGSHRIVRPPYRLD